MGKILIMRCTCGSCGKFDICHIAYGSFCCPDCYPKIVGTEGILALS